MNLKRLAIGLVLVSALVGVNVLAYRSVLGPQASAWDAAPQLPEGVDIPDDGVPLLAWPTLEKTTVDSSSHQLRFPDDLKKLAGTTVRLSGVLCVLDNLVVDGKVTACILQPPSKIGCCGISCDPRPELMVFIDCKDKSFPPPAKKSLAVVTGRLELSPDDSSWCLYTLAGADVRVLDQR